MKKQQTQKQKSQKNETIRTIIIGAIAFIIFLLLAFSDDIVNLYYKNKIAKLENSNIEIIEGSPNAPKLSAGMIPVKCVDTYWQITTQDNWYNYSNGEPAYMMLNDGTYQSELVQNMDRNNQKLASENINAQIQQNQVGSIYMWIPRFEINDNTGEIKYIQDVGKAEDGYTIPDIFMYKQIKETAPDFLLTGVWVAIDTDANYSTTINNMTGEDNTYGFIANTKAVQITSDDINTIQKFVGVGVPDDPQQDDTANVVGNDALAVPPINDLTNTNRIILKIINTKDIAPKLTFNVNGGTTTVENIAVKYGETITMPTPERIYTVKYVTNNSQTLEDSIVAYNFDGWYTDATDGEKREYTTMPAHNETLYAHWTETSITLPMPTPESKYFTLDGWYSNSAFTTSIGAGGGTYTPTSNITLYAKWQTQADYYGALVTNYSAGGVSSWRIFHIDDNDNIYLITDDCVAYDNLPKSTKGNALYKSSTYCVNMGNILDDYTGSAWIRENSNTKAQEWLSYVSSYPNSTNENIKAVAYMMDTDSWSNFAKSTYAEYAIGGPTLELFCASYKVTHPNKYVECDSVTQKGYKVKWSTSSSYTNQLSHFTQNDFNGIYIKGNLSSGYYSWLASPGSGSSWSLTVTSYDGVLMQYECNDNGTGFRPIVCLKSSVKLVSNGDGTYKIQ